MKDRGLINYQSNSAKAVHPLKAKSWGRFYEPLDSLLCYRIFYME